MNPSSTSIATLNRPTTIVMLGRGHSGTRLISKTLKESGVFTGHPLNVADDLLPAQPLYAACRLMGPSVKYRGNYSWDFEEAVNGHIPDAFIQLMETYLSSLITSNENFRGWKIPETNMIYPWLVRILPEAKFIFWVRDPRDVMTRMSGEDRLEKWNIPCRKMLIHSGNFRVRAASWKYYYDIVKQTPAPKNLITVRFEDFILKQEATLNRLEEFLGLDLLRVPVDPSKIGVWRRYWLIRNFKMLRPAMQELGYL